MKSDQQSQHYPDLKTKRWNLVDFLLPGYRKVDEETIVVITFFPTPFWYYSIVRIGIILLLNRVRYACLDVIRFRIFAMNYLKFK